MSRVVGAPVGHWAGTVSYGPKIQEFTVEFADDGGLTLSTTETTGHGTWFVTGDNTFDFVIRETLNQGDSGRSGDTVVTGIDHLVVTISAQVTDSYFEGSGTAEVFDAAGTIIFSVPAQLNAYQQTVAN